MSESGGAPILSGKIPFTFLVPFFYLLFVSSALLYVVLLPFVYLYGMMRCAEVWIDWEKEGKDVLVIEWDSAHSHDWMLRLRPLVGERAVYLNWSHQKEWDSQSLAAQLFAVFGPHGMPEIFTSRSLPAAIVFRPLRRPKVFTFGDASKNQDQKLDELRSTLTLS